MIIERDIWAAAKVLIDNVGTDAPIQTAIAGVLSAL